VDYSGLYHVDRRKKKSKAVLLFRQYFVPVVLVVAIAFLLQWTIRTLVFYPVRIDTDSMESFLKKGERVFLIYPRLAKLQTGDTVYVEHEGLNFLCTIVAGEGEIVQIINKSLFINHILKKDFSGISKDSTIFPSSISMRDNTGELLTGPGKFICLNNNWENIQDSRTWGTFSFDEIKGKVLFKKHS